MICPICKRDVDALRAMARNGKYVSARCDSCHNNGFRIADSARKYERDWQRRHYAKDLVQPSDTDYAKAYGVDQAKDRGWSEDDLRKHA